MEENIKKRIQLYFFASGQMVCAVQSQTPRLTHAKEPQSISTEGYIIKATKLRLYYMQHGNKAKWP